jgi:hypothetical protein
MVDWNELSKFLKSRRNRRVSLQVSFWAVLLLLVLSIAVTYVIPGQTQQSAYGDEWNDLGKFREDLNRKGVETTALVSSPLLLSDIDHPEQTIFVISGVERDTISLPRFTGEDDLVQFSEGDGVPLYSRDYENCLFWMVYVAKQKRTGNQGRGLHTLPIQILSKFTQIVPFVSICRLLGLSGDNISDRNRKNE